MSVKQIVKQLQERIDESLDNIEAVQGEKFRDLLAFVMNCSQTMRLMHVLGAKYDEDMVHVAGKQVAECLSRGSSLLAEAYQLSDEQLEELMKWVETLDGHVDNAMREANK